jgi:hypothetical protein
MVFAVAKETGWSERFIAWELPMIRALEYHHASLWIAGAWTVRHERSAVEDLAMIAAYVDDDDEL